MSAVRRAVRKALRGLRARGTQYKPGLWNVAETTVSTPKWNNPIGRAIGPRRKATLRTTFQDDGNDVKVFGTDPIPEKMRGYGAGVKHYEGMIRRASARGGALVSDHNVSPEAKRVYGALARRGYKVSQDATSGRYRVSKSRTHGPYTIKAKGRTARAYVGRNEVAIATIHPKRLFSRTMEIQSAIVSRDHRRKGLATALYNALERKHRRKLVPSGVLSNDAKALWANRTVRKDMSPILKAAVAKARRSLPAPKTRAQAERRAALYERFAAAPGKRSAGGKARIAIAQAEARYHREHGDRLNDLRGGSHAGARAWNNSESARATTRMEQEKLRAKALSAARRKQDKNNDGYQDGLKPKGAKPRKTATEAASRGAKVKQERKPSNFRVEWREPPTPNKDGVGSAADRFGREGARYAREVKAVEDFKAFRDQAQATIDQSLAGKRKKPKLRGESAPPYMSDRERGARMLKPRMKTTDADREVLARLRALTPKHKQMIEDQIQGLDRDTADQIRDYYGMLGKWERRDLKRRTEGSVRKSAALRSCVVAAHVARINKAIRLAA